MPIFALIRYAGLLIAMGLASGLVKALDHGRLISDNGWISLDRDSEH